MTIVSVACKLPQGIHLTHKGKTVKLAGANACNNRFGFGVTPGVDGDWFNDWATGDGKDFAAVKNGSLFAMAAPKIADAVTERRADPSVQTGLEPLDPDQPGNGLEPTDETKRALMESPRTDVR